MRRVKFVGAPFVLFGIALFGVTGLVVASLWNALIPPIFGLTSISFWQALGLFLLSRVLFGRLDGFSRRVQKMRFVRGWKGLTPEERERFRNALRPTGQPNADVN